MRKNNAIYRKGKKDKNDSRLEQGTSAGTINAVLSLLATGNASDVLASFSALVLGTFGLGTGDEEQSHDEEPEVAKESHYCRALDIYYSDHTHNVVVFPCEATSS